MNDEGVPKDLQQRIRDYLEEEAHPAARTLVIFADEDDLFEIYRLQVDVPESFRWGSFRSTPDTGVGRVRAVRGRGPRRREVQVLRGLAPEQRPRGIGDQSQRFQGGRPPAQRALPQGRRFDRPRPGRPQTRGQHPQLLQGTGGEDPRHLLPGGGAKPDSRRSQREDGRVSSRPPQRAQGAGSRRGALGPRGVRGRATRRSRGHQGARNTSARRSCSMRSGSAASGVPTRP